MNEKTVTVGGAPMYPSKNIVQNAVNSKDHTTLVAAVKAAGLVETLQSPGPFTVFAPTNDAFKKLPAGTVDTLLKPENKKTLTNVLTYHVVAGRMTAKDLMEAVKQGGGKAFLKTVEGEPLSWVKEGKPDYHRRQGRHLEGDHPAMSCSRTASSTWWTRFCCRADPFRLAGNGAPRQQSPVPSLGAQ